MCNLRGCSCFSLAPSCLRTALLTLPLCQALVYRAYVAKSWCSVTYLASLAASLQRVQRNSIIFGLKAYTQSCLLAYPIRALLLSVESQPRKGSAKLASPPLPPQLFKVAGLFWATAKSEKQPGKQTSSIHAYKKRMSEPPSCPNLTPQFCFNQTALQGTLEQVTVAESG